MEWSGRLAEPADDWRKPADDSLKPADDTLSGADGSLRRVDDLLCGADDSRRGVDGSLLYENSVFSLKSQKLEEKGSPRSLRRTRKFGKRFSNNCLLSLTS